MPAGLSSKDSAVPNDGPVHQQALHQKGGFRKWAKRRLTTDLDEDDVEILRQTRLLREARRMEENELSFKNESIKERAERLSQILYVYAMEHPEVGYRQGMHEVLSFVLLVVEIDLLEEETRHRELLKKNAMPSSTQTPLSRNKGGSADDRGGDAAFSAPPPHSSSSSRGSIGGGMAGVDSSGNIVVIRLLDPAHLMHDTFSLFECIMTSLAPAYDAVPSGDDATAEVLAAAREERGESPMEAMTSSIVSKIRFLARDEELFGHVLCMPIPPQLYCSKWVRLMFGREVFGGMGHVMRLWDAFFDLAAMTASLEGHSGIPVSMALMNVLKTAAAAMVILIRHKLLKPAPGSTEPDLNDGIGYLMNYPQFQDIGPFVETISTLLVKERQLVKSFNSNRQNSLAELQPVPVTPAKSRGRMETENEDSPLCTSEKSSSAHHAARIDHPLQLDDEPAPAQGNNFSVCSNGAAGQISSGEAPQFTQRHAHEDSDSDGHRSDTGSSEDSVDSRQEGQMKRSQSSGFIEGMFGFGQKRNDVKAADLKAAMGRALLSEDSNKVENSTKSAKSSGNRMSLLGFQIIKDPGEVGVAMISEETTKVKPGRVSPSHGSEDSGSRNSLRSRASARLGDELVSHDSSNEREDYEVYVVHAPMQENPSRKIRTRSKSRSRSKSDGEKQVKKVGRGRRKFDSLADHNPSGKINLSSQSTGADNHDMSDNSCHVSSDFKGVPGDLQDDWSHSDSESSVGDRSSASRKSAFARSNEISRSMRKSPKELATKLEKSVVVLMKHLNKPTEAKAKAFGKAQKGEDGDCILPGDVWEAMSEIDLVRKELLLQDAIYGFGKSDTNTY